ncbi:MAG: hypothetical protein Q9176_002278 [Flavoplaca citrina]
MGPDKIVSFITSAPNGSRVLSIKFDSSNVTRKPSVAAVDFNGKVNGVVSFLTVEPDVGRERGLVRLLQDNQDNNKWKTFTLLTAMHESEGHEETIGSSRPNGVDHGNHPGRKNWQEQRIATENYEGHDIAHDFYEHGYDVTIVQSLSTYVMSSKNGLDVLLGGLYEEGGPQTEDADIMFMSIPNAMLKRMHQDAKAEISRRDEKILKGLEKAGFKLDDGPDDTGFFMKYFQRGGGYYIDVGCSQLIIDGKIKVKQGQEIRKLSHTGYCSRMVSCSKLMKSSSQRGMRT